MIIYIHGFGSSGKSKKANILKELFKDKGIIAPSLSFTPDLAISTLEEFIESYLKYEEIYLIGASLGGFYATYLSNKYNLKAVLINPAVNPLQTLKKVLGYAPNYYDNSKFLWSQDTLDMLGKYEVTDFEEKNFMLLLQKGDEVLDYKEAQQKFKNANIIIQEGGSHSFEGIEQFDKSILEFFGIKRLGNYQNNFM